MTDKTEIFRHLRPQFFDRRQGQMNPVENGGISFLLNPQGEKLYHYWIYICPKDIQFSAKQSVKSLRDARIRGAIPWGSINLDGTPVIDQLIGSVLSITHGLPTEVNAYMREILACNNYSEARLIEFKSNMEVNRAIYEND